MRLAWFSPMPPERSGVAAYSAELLPHLGSHTVDTFPELGAHNFLWKHRRQPYDLIVYQLGNAPCHDYMWAYLAAFPGLVVLHDARLHHARARQLLQARRFDDYRRELAYDHPDARADVAEYAIAGLSGCLYYFWPMVRVVMETARTVAVHNTRVADDLRREYPEARIESIRMGVDDPHAATDARQRIRHDLDVPDDAVVFVAFGKVTAEKRISTILEALRALRRQGTCAWLLIVGDPEGGPAVSADGVRLAGYVGDEAIDDYLAAADACLCLRWPTALETSASWLRCLAAGRATVISDLPHLVDVPESVALRVDLLNEAHDLFDAMQRLASDVGERQRLGRAARTYWEANHTLHAMVEDYQRLLPATAARPAPAPANLPAHFTDDYSRRAREMVRGLGLTVDILER